MVVHGFRPGEPGLHPWLHTVAPSGAKRRLGSFCSSAGPREIPARPGPCSVAARTVRAGKWSGQVEQVRAIVGLYGTGVVDSDRHWLSGRSDLWVGSGVVSGPLAARICTRLARGAKDAADLPQMRLQPFGADAMPLPRMWE